MAGARAAGVGLDRESEEVRASSIAVDAVGVVHISEAGGSDN